MGVKRAALRKLRHELGLSPTLLTLQDVHFLTRILYLAPSDDSTWGEHEVDHILFIKKDIPISALNVNHNEVNQATFITQHSLKDLVCQHKLTPWFELISRQFLDGWWSNLDGIIKSGGSVLNLQSTIHNLKVDTLTGNTSKKNDDAKTCQVPASSI